MIVLSFIRIPIIHFCSLFSHSTAPARICSFRLPSHCITSECTPSSPFKSTPLYSSVSLVRMRRESTFHFGERAQHASRENYSLLPANTVQSVEVHILPVKQDSSLRNKVVRA